MNQQINLYQVEKKKVSLDFTFRYACFIFAAFGGLLLILTTSDVIKHLIIRKEFKVLDKEQREKSSKLQTIAGKVPQEQDRNVIIEQIKGYEAEKQSKQEILSLLAAAQSAKVSGFGSYFESLARGAVPGLWITTFSFKENGSNLSFHGKTLKPELVPRLISALGAEPVFSGRSFQSFRINLNEKTNELSFVLETNPATQP